MSVRGVLRAGILLSALAFALAGGAAAGPTVVMPDDTPFHATPDIVEFVLAIAGPTAQAPGDRSGDRVVTIGRNSKGELVVTSIAQVADGHAPRFPAGTLAALIVRHQGECQPPHGNADAAALDARVFSFFVDYRGETVWELGYENSFAVFHSVKGAGETGPQETFNIDPAKYRIYTCAKYE